MNTVTWTAIAAAWGILLAGAAGVMKTTDAVRSWAEQHLPFTPPSYTWIIVPFGVGIVTCVTSHLNPLVTLYPPLAHTYGEVLSGIALGAIASPLHHGTALLSAAAKAKVGTADLAIDPTADQSEIPPEAAADADAPTGA